MVAEAEDNAHYQAATADVQEKVQDGQPHYGNPLFFLHCHGNIFPRGSPMSRAENATSVGMRPSARKC